MEKKDTSKIIAIVSLVVAVIALSIGFATFSATLNISGASAEVQATNTFTPNVKYKSGSVTCDAPVGGATVVSTGSLDSTYVTWSNVSVTLTAPGDSVTCHVDVKNDSVFVAYLKQITFASALTCAAKTGTGVNSASSAITDVVCGATGIKATVTSGSNSAYATGAAATNNTTISTNNTIAANGGESTIDFKIEYPSGIQAVDGDITVTIPQIGLEYSSANA